MCIFILRLILITIILFGCSSRELPTPPDQFGNYEPPDNSQPPSPDPLLNEKTRWDVPGGAGEIVRGCLGLDCIPSLEDPALINLDDATYLQTASPEIYPLDLMDNEGNVWNLLGEATS